MENNSVKAAKNSSIPGTESQSLSTLDDALAFANPQPEVPRFAYEEVLAQRDALVAALTAAMPHLDTIFANQRRVVFEQAKAALLLARGSRCLSCGNTEHWHKDPTAPCSSPNFAESQS